MKQETIVGYTYQVENLCGRCTLMRMSGDHWDPDAPIANSENVLSFVAPFHGIRDRFDETTFDQSVFPKVLYAGDVDPMSHCNCCGANFLEDGPEMAGLA